MKKLDGAKGAPGSSQSISKSAMEKLASMSSEGVKRKCASRCSRARGTARVKRMSKREGASRVEEDMGDEGKESMLLDARPK